MLKATNEQLVSGNGGATVTMSGDKWRDEVTMLVSRWCDYAESRASSGIVEPAHFALCLRPRVTQ